MPFDELKEISADKQRRMVYEARLKAQRDRWMFEDDARADGIEIGLAKGRAEGLTKGRAEGLTKGRAEGLAKGMEKGMEKGIIKTAKNLKNIGIPAAQIAQATGLSIQEIENL
jgi:predicted transposase/invertase (TIGR01784 family)